MVSNIVAVKSSKKNVDNGLDGASLSNLSFWAAGIVILVGGISQYYLSNYHTLLKFVLLLASGFISAFLVARTSQGRQGLKLWFESVEEIKRVVWPTRQETLQMTGIVMLLVLVLASILWIIDALILRILTLIAG